MNPTSQVQLLLFPIKKPRFCEALLIGSGGRIYSARPALRLAASLRLFKIVPDDFSEPDFVGSTPPFSNKKAPLSRGLFIGSGGWLPTVSTVSDCL